MEMEMGSSSKSELSSRRLPSFFKVMFGDFYDCLSIPDALVDLFDGELPREFVLRTGDGRERHVTVTNVENKVVLKNGWNDFVRENSLKLGEFVVFQHDGESKFNVRIFGKSGCSREARRVNTTAKRSNVIELGTGTSNPCDRSESKEGQPFQDVIEEFERKARIIEAGNKFTSKLPCTTDKSGVGISIPRDPSERSSEDRPAQDVLSAIERKARAVEAADKFTSELPFFKVNITPTYILSNYVSIPTNFFQAYMKKADQIIKLQVSERSWHVKLKRYYKGEHARLSSGWPAFVKANTLQDGDVCVFELLEESTMRVSIFRDSG